MADLDRERLLSEEGGFGEWVRHSAGLFWDDITAWSVFIYRWLFTHWPLGPIKTYPPTESANFATINNEKTRLLAISRKKKEGAWRSALRWVCLMLLGISVACLYQFIHGTLNYVDAVCIYTFHPPANFSLNLHSKIHEKFS